MPEINDWDIAAANNNDAPPDGWPENTMQYSEVNNTAREGMAVVARFYQDSNGTLTTGGVADAYTLTLNAGYAAYFAGMYVAAAFNATNTGAVTINVNGIGLQNIVDRGGNALNAGEIQSGGIYELRYDGTDFQLMGSLVGQPTLASVILTNTNDPDLVDTDVAINIGAADPDVSQHIEIGPQAIQSKSNINTAAELQLQNVGGVVRIPQSDKQQLRIGANFNTAGMPLGASGDLDVGTWIQCTSGQQVGYAAYVNDGVRNRRVFFGVHDNDVWGLAVSDTSIVGDFVITQNGELMFGAAPNGASAMYFNGVLVAETGGNGTFNIQAIDNTLTSTIQLRLTQLGNTTQAIFGFEAADDDTLSVQNQRTNGEIDIRANDGGVIRNYIEIDPQLDQVRGFFNGNAKWQFNETGLNDIGMAGQIADSGDTLRPIGMNVMPPETVSADMTFALIDNGQMKVHDEGATTRSWTVDQSADIPIGALYGIVNIGGDITLVSGAGVAFEYFDGSVFVNTTANITLGDGQFTIYKRSDIEYIISGPNIT